MRVLPMGSRAVLVDDVGDPTAWSEGLRRLDMAGVVDVVPAATTVLIACADEAALASVRSRLGEVVPIGAAERARRGAIEIPVRYDGDDLDDVARATGLSVDEVIAAHSAPTYVVAFCGFAPGFAYLRGIDVRLRVPRRATPRTRVPAGSVAVAAEYTAVYPRPTPGGWNLLGTTAVAVFEPNRSRPALIEPGAHVRFVPE